MILKLFLLFELFLISFGLEWADEDGIYIRDDVVALNHESRSDLIKATQPVTAIPVEIVIGHCLKASECYPILFYANGQVVDPTLYKSILNTASYCEQSDLPQQALDKERSDHNSEDVYVWCPIRSFPSRKPKSLQDVNSTTTEIEVTPMTPSGSCGQIKGDAEQGEGDDKAGLRVVGGQETLVGQYPWMVALTNQGRHFCSGSLIDDRHVLVAAHCLNHIRRKDLKNLKAYIGDHHLRSKTDVVHQTRNVTAVIFHANFTMRTVHNDIGMVYLSEAVAFNENVAPICLPDQDSQASFEDGTTHGTLTGWGQPGLNKSSSLILMKAQLRIWKHEECVEIYKDKIPGGISNSMFCAGSGRDAAVVQDSCKGDSGAPLTLIRNNRTEQIGIVSFGIGCGQYPGVYSKVDLDWIERHRMKASKYFQNEAQ